ncbi:MAG: sugar phosphate isomerase/epimerase [Chloroflexi bacterium]|nr:sugar phosphate isomerase/epimerase [Chloroflexota bacterium]
MKLSLDTYSIGKNLTIRDLLELLPANGFQGVEFRCESNQAHGVELETPVAERRRIRTLLNEAGIEVSCLSTSQRYESPDPAVRAQVIERVKRFVDLAADMGCGRIRTFGNDFPAGVDKLDVVKYVGESLRAVGEHAADKGVDVLLEMHGQFYYWEYALGAIKVADHPNVAINYNCDEKDLVKGSVAFTFNQVKDHVRHVHMHALESPVFPYKELFGLLKGMGYANFCSLEEGYGDGGEKKVIALYAALYREILAQS